MHILLHRIRTGALLGLLFAAGGALAQANPSSIADCHGIASSEARLACYDAVTGRGGPARTTAQQPISPPSPAAADASARGTATAPDALTHAVSTQTANQKAASMIDAAWDFDPSSSPYVVRFFHDNYLLVGRYTNDVNNAPYVPLWEASGQPPQNLNHTEAKFQLSFKARVWTTDDRRFGVWAGYTQQNQWQVYNGDVSRPFRETNYMPELFLSYRPDIELPGGFRWKLVNFGYNHQSNGRSDTLSRSWDRLVATFGVERESLAIVADVWYRLPEKASSDDNPNITDYYGYAQIGALYRWRDNSFSGIVRGNVRTGKGAVQLAWNSPPIIGPFRGYVQFFSGYGESLIDYNWKQTTIGAGISLSDGL